MYTPLRALAALCLTCAFAAPACANDRMSLHPIQRAIDNATAAGKLDGSVKFFIVDAPPDAVVVQADTVTNRKTSAVFKSDEAACDWAAQSALISLQDAAKKAGANAVVNVVSFYKKRVREDRVNYECHAGAAVAGVALRGDLAVVK